MLEKPLIIPALRPEIYLFRLNSTRSDHLIFELYGSKDFYSSSIEEEKALKVLGVTFIVPVDMTGRLKM